MNAAADSTVRADRLCAFEVFRLRSADNLFVRERSGGACVDALATERARRFKKFIVEERGYRIFLSAPLDRDRSGLLPIVADVCAAEARDAVVVVSLDERVVVLSFLSDHQGRERIPFRIVFFGGCVQFTLLERDAFGAVGRGGRFREQHLKNRLAIVGDRIRVCYNPHFF